MVMTEKPLYNIGAVTRLTGVPIPTLRAWERRYGFPHASRTAGGHRLYSERDVIRLRWVKSQVDSGMAASQAVLAAQSLEEEGKLFTSMVPEEHAGTSEKKSPTAGLRDNLFEALIHHDLAGADRLMGEMLAFYSPEELTLEVIGPVLERIGDAWEQGQMTIVTEHHASYYLRHRLLMWMMTGPTPRPINPIVLACAPGEWHEGSLLMMGVLLRRRGFPVTYLGQDVPVQSMAEFIQEIQPSAVLLIAMRAETAQALIDYSKQIPQVKGRPLVVFGGRAFLLKPELQELVAGIYLGDSIQEGARKLESLLV